MVDYEFQARRIGRMSDYIDRRTATLGLHAAWWTVRPIWRRTRNGSWPR